MINFKEAICSYLQGLKIQVCYSCKAATVLVKNFKGHKMPQILHFGNFILKGYWANLVNNYVCRN